MMMRLALLTAITASMAAEAHAQTAPSSHLHDGTLVRIKLDGSGPSHLLAHAGSLIVLDPNEGVLRRWKIAPDETLSSTSAACAFDRTFSPRFAQEQAHGLRLIGEDPTPTETASNAKLPVLFVTDALLESLPTVAVGELPNTSCGTAIKTSAQLLPPPVRTKASLTFLASSPLGRLTVVPDETNVQLISANSAGYLTGVGPVVIQRQIREKPESKIDVEVHLVVYGKRAVSIILHEHEPQADGSVVGLHKRGFEYAQVAGHSLYILGKLCDDYFCIRKYDLSGLQARPNDPAIFKTFDLTDNTSPDPDEYSLSGAEGPQDLLGPVNDTRFFGKDDWNTHLKHAIAAYAFHRWHYPRAFRAWPCKAGPSECRVRLVNGVVSGYDKTKPIGTKIYQEEDDKDEALWVGPRHLINASVGTNDDAELGIPYSFGGAIGPKGFEKALAHPDARPIGHLRGQLTKVDSDHYPLGIDCSAFVGRVLDIDQGTKVWVTNTPTPDKAAFVPNLMDAQPGDVIFKKGHIVIFSRRVDRGNYGIEVFEAASRCGRVCRSVYEPDFFNGWSIMRVRQVLGEDKKPIPNAYWKALTTPTWQRAKRTPTSGKKAVGTNASQALKT